MKSAGRILFVVAILWGIAVIPVNFLGKNYPTSGLVAALFCGSGYEIVVNIEVNEEATRLRNSVSSTTQCVNAEGKVGNDSIGTTLLIAGIVPAVVLGAIAVALMNAGNLFASFGGRGGMNEMAKIAENPAVKAQLDVLMEDLKAGRVSYKDYVARSKNIIESHKAQEAGSS